MRRTSISFSRQAGASLIEVLIAMLISMITMLAIGHMYVNYHQQRRLSNGVSDAQSEAALALFSLEREARKAGYGFNVLSVLGCTIRSYYNGQQPEWTLAPATIADGGGPGKPDTVNFVASSKDNFAVPAQIVQTLPNPAANWKVNSTEGMSAGDILIAHYPGESICSMVQVTNVGNNNASDKITVVHNSGQSPWNPNGNADSTYVFDNGIEEGTNIFNLGALSNHRFYISNGNLMADRLDTATNAWVTETAVSNVVNLQAEYGKDTNSDGNVDTWNTTVPATNAEWRQVIALRVGVLARSDGAEKSAITTVAPTWSGGAFDMTNVPNWQLYRYRVMETIVPLRNVIWSS